MAVVLRTLSANDGEALEQVRQYFRNYAGWLGVDLSYQNFDQEMASLPGAYSAPEGRLFFAEVDGRPAGCVGVRALSGSEGVCEMKRLYVTPEERGHGVGAALALAVIKAAKEIGYRKLMLDTVPAGTSSPPSTDAKRSARYATGVGRVKTGGISIVRGGLLPSVDTGVRTLAMSGTAARCASRVMSASPRATAALTSVCSH